MKYKILQADYVEELSRMVHDHMLKGYKPHGSLQILQMSDTLTYIQPVVEYENEKRITS